MFSIVWKKFGLCQTYFCPNFVHNKITLEASPNFVQKYIIMLETLKDLQYPLETDHTKTSALNAGSNFDITLIHPMSNIIARKSYLGFNKQFNTSGYCYMGYVYHWLKNTFLEKHIRVSSWDSNLSHVLPIVLVGSRLGLLISDFLC